MGSSTSKANDNTIDKTDEQNDVQDYNDTELPDGDIIQVGDEKKYYINHIAGIASGKVIPIVDDQPVNGPPTIRGDTIYYSNGSEILKWLDEDADQGLYLISINDDNRKLMKKVKELLLLNTEKPQQTSQPIMSPSPSPQPQQNISSDDREDRFKEAEDEDEQRRPQYGGMGKVFYKGYYYKVRKEGRKLFIKTKNEGDISFTKVQRWASRHCKY